MTYLNKRKFFLMWIWILILILALSARDEVSTILLSILLLSQILIVVQFWYFARSKDNKLFLLDRYYEIDGEKLVGILDDGSSSVIMNTHFIKVVQTKHHYLLYISKAQFIYIPVSAFQHKSDREWFNENVVQRIKTR